jgi:hypothetical protein
MVGKITSTMMSLVIAGFAAASLGLASAPTPTWAADAPAAKAKPCRDDKGKFTKCPAPEAAKPKPCRDAKGKFIKCPKP